ncbi:MAG: Asp-tRNA(Asn)/Glu-tRNA(Gln) amidotransferase GatCAB subunit B [Candidatus Methanomethylicota archaeon]|nr:MAG: Asp-tRNA(Asn)/Glu-tRNA(Gln) amidotransferase GatCAB subunit B [Candidatus Verstraetearchaeota archaeon]
MSFAELEPLIGFEVHVQVNCREKLFCSCPTDYLNVPPNTNVCPICTGQPGAKPMPPNAYAIRAALAVSMMLNCEVRVGEHIYWLRKHYPYPDLPKGYQIISQPIGVNGCVKFRFGSETREVRIREVHVEEDAGRWDPESGRVDYNRCGVPLIEIVTHPDMRSPEEARAFADSLLRILKYLNCVRVEGTRFDTNVSIKGGARVEIKNINSVKGVFKALLFEISRQRSLMAKGLSVKRETRHFDEDSMITIPMRVKETVEDYRYIPDPDLYPFVVTQRLYDEVKSSLPESPYVRLMRFIREYGLSFDDAYVLTSEYELANFFEEVAKHVPVDVAAKWVRYEVKRELNYRDLPASEIPISPQQLVKLIRLVESGEITVPAAKKVIGLMFDERLDPEVIVERYGLRRKVDLRALGEAIELALEKYPKAVKDYKSGNEKAIFFLVGKVKEALSSRVEPQLILRMLKERLEEMSCGS